MNNVHRHKYSRPSMPPNINPRLNADISYPQPTRSFGKVNVENILRNSFNRTKDLTIYSGPAKGYDSYGHRVIQNDNSYNPTLTGEFIIDKADVVYRPDYNNDNTELDDPTKGNIYHVPIVSGGDNLVEPHIADITPYGKVAVLTNHIPAVSIEDTVILNNILPLRWKKPTLNNVYQIPNPIQIKDINLSSSQLEYISNMNSNPSESFHELINTEIPIIQTIAYYRSNTVNYDSEKYNLADNKNNINIPQKIDSYNIYNHRDSIVINSSSNINNVQTQNPLISIDTSIPHKQESFVTDIKDFKAINPHNVISVHTPIQKDNIVIDSWNNNTPTIISPKTDINTSLPIKQIVTLPHKRDYDEVHETSIQKDITTYVPTLHANIHNKHDNKHDKQQFAKIDQYNDNVIKINRETIHSKIDPLITNISHELKNPSFTTNDIITTKPEIYNNSNKNDTYKSYENNYITNNHTVEMMNKDSVTYNNEQSKHIQFSKNPSIILYDIHSPVTSIKNLVNESNTKASTQLNQIPTISENIFIKPLRNKAIIHEINEQSYLHQPPIYIPNDIKYNGKNTVGNKNYSSDIIQKLPATYTSIETAVNNKHNINNIPKVHTINKLESPLPYISSDVTVKDTNIKQTIKHDIINDNNQKSPAIYTTTNTIIKDALPTQAINTDNITNNNISMSYNDIQPLYKRTYNNTQNDSYKSLPNVIPNSTQISNINTLAINKITPNSEKLISKRPPLIKVLQNIAEPYQHQGHSINTDNNWVNTKNISPLSVNSTLTDKISQRDSSSKHINNKLLHLNVPLLSNISDSVIPENTKKFNYIDHIKPEDSINIKTDILADIIAGEKHEVDTVKPLIEYYKNLNIGKIDLLTVRDILNINTK